MKASFPRSPAWVAPGNYDGVHLGHRALLAAAHQGARAAGLPLRVLTFDPHPTVIVAPERAPIPLTTPARRQELLQEAGADEVVIQKFTPEFALLSAEAFCKEVLKGELGAEAVVIGDDFHFGANRKGNVALLRAQGGLLGFRVERIAPVAVDNVPASSSRIRALLAEGAVDVATRLLGREHEVSGAVIRGQQRGRQLGFPTANLELEPVLLPKDGVYAVIVQQLDARAFGEHLGVANLGVRPTFAAGRSVEVHMLDFAGDLYGASVRVRFVARLRDERRFETVDALRDQITQDIAAARALSA